MDFEEIAQTFHRTKMLVKAAATRSVRVAVMADGRPEPVVLGSSTVQQAQRFGAFMEEAGFRGIELTQRAAQLGYDVLFVPAGAVASALATL